MELLLLLLGVAVEDSPLLHRLVTFHADVRLQLRHGLFQVLYIQLEHIYLLRTLYGHILVVFNTTVFASARISFL